TVDVVPRSNVEGPSALDPVVEIVDANGQRFHACKDPGDDNPPEPIIADPTPDAFDDDCVNDDVELGVKLNSHLDFQVPGASGTQTALYLHVLDSRGDARPDMVYDLSVLGAVQPLSFGGQSISAATIGQTYSQYLSVGGGSGGGYRLQLAPSTSPLPP